MELEGRVEGQGRVLGELVGEVMEHRGALERCSDLILMGEGRV